MDGTARAWLGRLQHFYLSGGYLSPEEMTAKEPSPQPAASTWYPIQHGTIKHARTHTHTVAHGDVEDAARHKDVLHAPRSTLAGKQIRSWRDDPLRQQRPVQPGRTAVASSILKHTLLPCSSVL
jgi:hypothetical protein